MKEFVHRLESLYGLLARVADYGQSPLLLLVRLYWGWQFAQTGWGKFHNLAGVTEYFTTLGLPMPGVTVVGIASLEFFGGILLALGLFSRPLGLVLTVNMVMAYVIADREALLSIFSDPDKFYHADPYTFLFASVLVLVFGPGKASADALLGRYFEKRL